MEKRILGKSNLQSSRLIYGCMRISGDGSTHDRSKGRLALEAAIEQGYTTFDHADIYGAGECEKLFGELLAANSNLRSQLTLISKAGIRRQGSPVADAPTRYDFSQQYLLDSVDGSLQRLNTDYLDLFLLHRPDYLFNADDVAATFEKLHAAGKVRHFGVSNFSPAQVALLQSRCSQPLLVNQVEINIHNIERLTDGTLDQCQQLQITPQAWCPIGGVAYPAWGNTFTADDEQRIADELKRQCAIYQVDDWVIALAWILALPAGVCPIVGSTTPARIQAAKQALSINYSREDWYRLLEARNGCRVP